MDRAYKNINARVAKSTSHWLIFALLLLCGWGLGSKKLLTNQAFEDGKLHLDV